MNYLNYDDCTVEQMAAHFRTISRQAVFRRIEYHTEKGNWEMVDKIKEAKILAKSKKYLKATIHN